MKTNYKYIVKFSDIEKHHATLKALIDNIQELKEILKKNGIEEY